MGRMRSYFFIDVGEILCRQIGRGDLWLNETDGRASLPLTPAPGGGCSGQPCGLRPAEGPHGSRGPRAPGRGACPERW